MFASFLYTIKNTLYKKSITCFKNKVYMEECTPCTSQNSYNITSADLCYVDNLCVFVSRFLNSDSMIVV